MEKYATLSYMSVMGEGKPTYTPVLSIFLPFVSIMGFCRLPLFYSFVVCINDIYSLRILTWSVGPLYIQWMLDAHINRNSLLTVCSPMSPSFIESLPKWWGGTPCPHKWLGLVSNPNFHNKQPRESVKRVSVGTKDDIKIISFSNDFSCSC